MVCKTSKVAVFGLAVAMLVLSCQPASAIFGRRRACSGCYQEAFFVPTFTVTLYQTSIDLEVKAAVEKALRDYGISPQPAPGQPQPAPGSQPPRPAGTPVLTAKCASCHGANQRAAAYWDMSKALDGETFARIVEMIGEGVNVPTQMTSVVKGITNEEKGQILHELIAMRHGNLPGGSIPSQPAAPPAPSPTDRQWDQKKRKWFIPDGRGGWVPEYISPYSQI